MNHKATGPALKELNALNRRDGIDAAIAYLKSDDACADAMKDLLDAFRDLLIRDLPHEDAVQFADAICVAAGEVLEQAEYYADFSGPDAMTLSHDWHGGAV